MSYRDRQLVGSLGGVDLLLKTIQGESGRRVTSLSFPGRDDPSHEDHGRELRRWKVEAVLVGENWDVDLQTLRDLFESPGPYRFVHPTEGEWSVVLDGRPSWSIDYNAEGTATVSVPLVEAGDQTSHLRVAASTGVDLSAASAAAHAALIASVQAAYDVGSGVTAFSRASAAIVSALITVSVAVGKVQAAMGVVDTLSLIVATAAAAPDALAAEVADLVGSLTGIWNAAAALILADQDDEEAAQEASPATVAAAPGVRSSALRGTVAAASGWDPGADAEEPADETEAANDLVIAQALTLTSVIAAAEAVVDLEFDSADAAQAMLADLAEAIDGQLESPVTDDGLYAALVDLKAKIDAHLQDVAGRLPSLTTVTPAETVPAILLAFELYDDPAEDAQILARNDVADPSLVPGGAPLEVLLG